MKRASIAATAALATLMAAGSAQADQQSDLTRDFTAFRQNTLDLTLKGDLAGVKALYDKTIDAGFTGQHDVTITVRPAAGTTDLGAGAGKPGELVISNPTVSFSFSAATTKPGYVQFVNFAEKAASDKTSADAQIMLPALLNNTKLTTTVQNLTVGPSGETAIVQNSIDGTIDADAVLKGLGYPGLPPMLTGVELKVKMDCTTTLKLGAAGAFTVASETCKGGLEAVAATKLPTSVPKAPVVPGAQP